MPGAGSPEASGLGRSFWPGGVQGRFLWQSQCGREGLGVRAGHGQVALRSCLVAGLPSEGVVTLCPSATHGCGHGHRWPSHSPAGLVWQEQMALRFRVFCSKRVL